MPEESDLRTIYRRMYEKLKQIQIEDRFVSALKSESETGYVDKSDDFFFQRLVDLIFQGGVRGVIWERYKDEIGKEFCDYKVEKVAEFGKEDVERMLANPKMFKNRRKIEACIHNAKEIVKISRQYGSFSNYIDKHTVKMGMWTFPKPDLIDEIQKMFKGVSLVNKWAFLRYVGLDVMKPDINVRRVIYRLGLTDSEAPNPKTIKQIQEVGRMWAEALGERVLTVDYVVYMYGAGETPYVKHSVCGDAPKCDECTLTEYCKLSKEFYLAPDSFRQLS